MSRAVWLAIALLCAACDAPRPAFLARLQQDCEGGDQDACGMLGTTAAAPSPRIPSAPVSRPRTPVQRDVDAIMRGMERTRAAPRARIPAPEQSFSP